MYIVQQIIVVIVAAAATAVFYFHFSIYMRVCKCFFHCVFPCENVNAFCRKSPHLLLIMTTMVMMIVDGINCLRREMAFRFTIRVEFVHIWTCQINGIFIQLLERTWSAFFFRSAWLLFGCPVHFMGTTSIWKRNTKQTYKKFSFRVGT